MFNSRSMKRLITVLLFILPAGIVCGQNNWYINFTPGLDLVMPAPLIIQQSGYKNITIWAEYKSSPFKMPVYYSYRLGFTNENNGYELEMNHLKVHLQNTTGEVSEFSISHGYNQLFLNRVKYGGKIGSKIGAGIVLAHPENTVRGLKLNEKEGLFKEGYYIAGPAIQYGIFKEIFITRRLYLLAECRVSLAYANVPVVNGRAHAPVLAFHIQLGPGFYWYGRPR